MSMTRKIHLCKSMHFPPKLTCKFNSIAVKNSKCLLEIWGLEFDHLILKFDETVKIQGQPRTF